MIKIVICDDEDVYRKQIRELINFYMLQSFEYDIIEFESGESFLEYSNGENMIDIVFMDIEMNEITGINAIKQFKKKYFNAIVFFVTSHNSYVTDIFRLGSFQFLQKPINEKDFAVDLERAIASYKRNHKLLEVKTKTTIYNILFRNILYVEVNHKKISIRTKKGLIEVCGRIRDYEKKLYGFGFVSCHKSIIVNLQYIENIDISQLKLFYCERLLPISRNYKASLVQEFSKFFRGISI